MSGSGPEDDLPEALVEANADRPQHFRLHGLLGRGGHGEVYRATMWREGGVQSEVAVKILDPEVAPGSDPVRRLEDEGRLLGALDHPVILKVFDLIVLEGRVALVTEFVDGHDLHDAIHGGELPVRGLVESVGAVADALHVAWSTPGPDREPLRLIHRDIKPQNIRLGIHGQVKLLDFGIAQATQLTRQRSGVDDLMGSGPYLPPERLVERAPPLTSKVDVWGLGCVLYEGLAGERLMEGLSLQQMYALGDAPEAFERFILQRLAELPPLPRLRPLLAPMLAIDPRDRPSSAEIAEACEELADSVPGMTLLRWARTRSWDENRSTGPLSARQLVESTLSPPPGPSRSAAPPPPLPPRSIPSVEPLAAAPSLLSSEADFDAPTVAPSVANEPLPSAPLSVDPAPLSPSAIVRWDTEVTGDEVELEAVDLPIDNDRVVEPPLPRRAIHPLWFLVGFGSSLVVVAAAIGLVALVFAGSGPAAIDPVAPGTPAGVAASAPPPRVAAPVPQPPAREVARAPVPAEREPAEPESAGEPGPAAEPEGPAAEPEGPAAEPEVPPGSLDEDLASPPMDPTKLPLPRGPEPVVLPEPVAMAAEDAPPPLPPPAPDEPATLITSGALVELRGEFGGFQAGTPLVVGEYEVWADFGEGLVDTGLRATAEPGGTVEVSCDRSRTTCYVRR